MSFFSSRRQPEQPTTPPVEERAPAPRPLPQPVGFDTVLGANCTVEGVLRSKANVRLDGTFSGTLEIEGNVLVGETAKITADINAKNVSIAGAVRGNVSGKKVQLLRTGRIWGDIKAMALTTEEGAFIDGKITMIGREPVEEDSTELTEPLFLDEASRAEIGDETPVVPDETPRSMDSIDSDSAETSL